MKKIVLTVNFTDKQYWNLLQLFDTLGLKWTEKTITSTLEFVLRRYLENNDPYKKDRNEIHKEFWGGYVRNAF